MGFELKKGWYALVLRDGNWDPQSGAENRASIAQMDAHDYGASHFGYWNGQEWEDVTPTL